MVDAQDPDLAGVLVELIDHAIGPTAGRPEPFELSPEGVPDRARVPTQGSDEELGHRGGGLLGEACERAIHRGSQGQLPATRTHRSR